MLGGVLVVWRSKLLLWYILLATLLSGVIMTVTDFLLQPFVVHHGINPASGVDAGFAYSGMLMSPVAGWSSARCWPPGSPVGWVSADRW